MSTKRTATPVKKSATKKNNKPTWKQTGEANIPGLGTIKEFEVKFNSETTTSAYDILQAENYALKQLLSKNRQEPMPQTNIEAKSSPAKPMLDQFHEEMDMQLARQYNAINTLSVLGERLQDTAINANGQVNGPQPVPQDYSSKFSNLVGYASMQNDRLESLVDKLSKLI